MVVKFIENSSPRVGDLTFAYTTLCNCKYTDGRVLANFNMVTGHQYCMFSGLCMVSCSWRGNVLRFITWISLSTLGEGLTRKVDMKGWPP